MTSRLQIWWHRFLHWLALRSNRTCPHCGGLLRPGNSYGVWAGEVYHDYCLEDMFMTSPPDVIRRVK